MKPDERSTPVSPEETELLPGAAEATAEEVIAAGKQTTGEAGRESQQTPREEALDRAAEQMPAFFLPRLIASHNVNEVLADSRDRVSDSHEVQMAVLRQQVLGGVEGGVGTGINVGAPRPRSGINVSGDSNVTINMLPLEPKKSVVDVAKTAVEAAVPSSPGKLAAIAKLVLAGSSLVGIGAAGPLVFQWLAGSNSDPPPVEAPADAEWYLDLDVQDKLPEKP